MLFGVGFEEAYSVVISSLGNVGPGIGNAVRPIHGADCRMQQNGQAQY